jgi:SsrA-binding protein
MSASIRAYHSHVRLDPIPMPEHTVALNRRARHDYAIEQTVEAGLVLTGTEIKSIRAGRANLAEAYARIERGEAWLIGAHIAPYEQGNRYNHEPTRTRKLLLRRGEIDELVGKTQAKGLTLVPLRLYIRNGLAKLEIGVGRGKKAHDKRRTIAERDMRRELERQTKDARIKL